MKKRAKLLQINIYNLTKKKIVNQMRIKRLVRYVLKKEDFKNLNILNIIIADARYLKDLNKKFFNKNRTTNVISFNLDYIGEIYISVEDIGMTSDLYYYLVHGLLHIVGYDHQNKITQKLMDNKCQRYLKKFSIL